MAKPFNIDILYNDNYININSSSEEEMIKKLTKKQTVKQHYDLSKLHVRPDGRCYYLLARDKQVSAKNMDTLIDKLYDLCVGKNTFLSVYQEWKEHCLSIKKPCEKTIKERDFIIKAIQNDEIFSKPLDSLTIKDWKRYFERLTAGATLTRSRFNDIKSVLNGTLYYATEEEIIRHNCISDIRYSQFDFKVTNNDDSTYSKSEREAIIKYLEPDNKNIFALAIRFQFEIGCRIGELRALRFDDVKKTDLGYQIKLCKFVNYKGELINHIKGNTGKGIRYIPLTDTALSIIESIKKINSNEYMFFSNNIFIPIVTYNRRLKKYCNDLNIEYHSSHGIRFNTLSTLSQELSLPELQKIAGHTTQAMTLHYLRDIEDGKSTVANFKNALKSNSASTLQAI